MTSSSSDQGDIDYHDPILYLDLAALSKPKEQKKQDVETQIAQDSQKIVEVAKEAQIIPEKNRDKLLRDVEQAIRDGLRVAGDHFIIEEVKNGLRQRMEEQKKLGIRGGALLTEQQLDEQFKIVETVGMNVGGPYAAREAFRTDQKTPVIVATNDPEKFADGKNIAVVGIEDVEQFQDSWENVVSRLSKAKEEVIIRNPGRGKFIIGGREVGISDLLGPPMEAKKLQKRIGDERLRVIRDGKEEGSLSKTIEVQRIKTEQGEKEEGSLSKTIEVQRIKTEQGEKEETRLGRNGKKLSVGAIFIQATDPDGKPLKTKSGDPILDIVQVENGKIKNIIINDPDGTRDKDGLYKNAGQDAALKTRYYDVNPGSELSNKLEASLGKIADAGGGSASISPEEFRSALTDVLQDAKPTQIEITKDYMEPLDKEAALRQKTDMFIGALIDDIRKDSPQFGLEKEGKALPAWMDLDNEMRPQDRMSKFAESVTEAAKDAEEKSNDPEKKEEILESLTKGDDAPFKREGEQIVFDPSDEVRAMAILTNEMDSISAGSAASATRMSSIRREVYAKIEAQESDSVDPIDSLERNPVAQHLPPTAQKEATQAGQRLHEAGARIAEQDKAANRDPDGRHLQRPKPPTPGQLQDAIGKLKPVRKGK